MTDRFAYAAHGVWVVFGDGALAELPGELKKLGEARALLVTTPGRAAALAAEVRELLGTALAGEFDRAEVHVPAVRVAEALEVFVASGAGCLVALGGGSAIGLAKAIALRTGAPIVALPTTYSGSEMTSIWGTSDRSVKRTGRDSRAAPRTVIYDPRLTLSLPAATSAASGMNAIAHCVEALYAPDANPVANLMAMEGIRLLGRCLPGVVGKPDDLPARSLALRGAHLAGWSLELTSMGLHHKLCHVLAGFGLPHAETHAALLPYVAAYNARAVPEAMAAVARALEAPEAWTGLHQLKGSLGLERNLRDLGLPSAELDSVAGLAIEGSYANPEPPRREGVRALLEAAFAGRAPGSPGQ